MTIMLTKPWEGRSAGTVMRLPDTLTWLGERLVDEGKAQIVNDPPEAIKHAPLAHRETR